MWISAVDRFQCYFGIELNLDINELDKIRLINSIFLY